MPRQGTIMHVSQVAAKVCFETCPPPPNSLLAGRGTDRLKLTALVSLCRNVLKIFFLKKEQIAIENNKKGQNIGISKSGEKLGEGVFWKYFYRLHLLQCSFHLEKSSSKSVFGSFGFDLIFIFGKHDAYVSCLCKNYK